MNTFKAFRIHQAGKGVAARLEDLSLDDLGAPKIFKDIAMYPRGICLVTGPTGSGKSTTLAAVLDRALERFPGSAELHDRLRRRLLWEGGPRALEAAYERWVAPLVPSR